MHEAAEAEGGRTGTTSTNSQPSTTQPPKPQISYRAGTPADAAHIRNLGATAFSETFGWSLPAADLEDYISTAYALSAITSELSDPADTPFIVAVAKLPGLSAESTAGFAQLRASSTAHEDGLGELPREGAVELQRLYVSADHQGRGIGSSLIKLAEEEARKRGFINMWLGVWELNHSANRAYAKAGYRHVGEHVFAMGPTKQTDWILWKEL